MRYNNLVKKRGINYATKLHTRIQKEDSPASAGRRTNDKKHHYGIRYCKRNPPPEECIF